MSQIFGLGCWEIDKRNALSLSWEIKKGEEIKATRNNICASLWRGVRDGEFLCEGVGCGESSTTLTVQKAPYYGAKVRNN